MNNPDAFERILASLYDAMLDETRWPATSALIDEACGITGNGLMVAEGPKDHVRAVFVGLYSRGQRREDLEREYLENYHSIDERVPRFPATAGQSPGAHQRPVHGRGVEDLTNLQRDVAPGRYAGRPERPSPRARRLPHRLGPERSRRLGGLGGFADHEGPEAAAPYPAVRPRPAGAGPRRGAEHDRDRPARQPARIGVLELDRRGRILEGNDRARSLLRHGDGLLDRNGMLRARAPADQVRLERLVGAALPASGAVAVSGSMVLRRSSVVPPFVVHVKPVGGPQPDHGARHVAALVLIVEPGRPHRIDPGLVATTLELTPAETQVAVGLAEGMSVGDMADATGHTKAAIYWHLQQIYQKHSISRQADLVRLVLSLAELG